MLGETTKLLKEVMTKGTESMRRGKGLNQLGVNYRGSSIVYEDDVDVQTSKGLGYNTESETAARPGDRAPGAPGLVDIKTNETVFGIYDIFSPSRHTILVFLSPSTDYKTLSDVITRVPDDTARSTLILPKGTLLPLQGHVADASELFDQILVDTRGYAYSGYHINGPSIAIIRPDGVIGARVRSAAGVKKYFQGIFLQ